MGLDTYQGYSSTDHARSVQTTIAKHFADLEPAMLRNYKLGALLAANGRVMMNQAGRGFEWDVQWRLHDLEGNTGETTRTFIRRNLFKKAYLPYRGYQATDAVYKKELKENRGREAYIKIWDGLVKRLEQSVEQGLATEYWKDGNASGNEKAWHGLESMFGINGTVKNDDGTQRTANAADFVGYPNDTYAGIITNLGNYDGSQAAGSVWPNGTADPEYDFWAPLVVNYTCNGFSPTTHTWREQGNEAMRYAITHSQRNMLPNDISHIFLARNLFYDAKNLMEEKERVVISSELDLRSFGFQQTFNFDGVQVTTENSIANGVGYGLNLKNIDLLSMEDKLVVPEGPEYDIETQSWRVVVYTLSNLKFKSPRCFFKLAALA